MKKVIYKGTVILTVVCLLVISLCFPASALSSDTLVFNCDHSPFFDNYDYVIEFLTKNYLGEYVPYIYGFNLYRVDPDNTNQSDFADAKVAVQFEYHNSIFDTIDLAPFYDGENAGIYGDIYAIDVSTGQVYLKGSFNQNHIQATGGYGIYGFHFYGNFVYWDSFPDSQYQKSFIINYASDALEINYLSSIFSSLSSISSKIVDYSSVLSNIRSYLNSLKNVLTQNFVDGLNQKLDILIQQNNQIIDNDASSDVSPPYDEVVPPRDDITIDDIKDAEEEALGGKTHEETKEEIEDTLDVEQTMSDVQAEEIPEADIIVVQNIFDVVLDCCGGKWRTFFVLNLTLAFACFVIGRRY